MKDVLDLGELLTTSVNELASAAFEAQLSVRVMKSYVSRPEYDQAEIQRELKEKKLVASKATRALRNLINSRVIWMVDRIGTLTCDALFARA